MTLIAPNSHALDPQRIRRAVRRLINEDDLRLRKEVVMFRTDQLHPRKCKRGQESILPRGRLIKLNLTRVKLECPLDISRTVSRRERRRAA